jgi:hypothetical protein
VLYEHEVTTRSAWLALALVVSCAKGKESASGDGGIDSPPADASGGDMCDQDNDGVFDGMDKCPGTLAGQVVNKSGCAESQLLWKLEPTFPPYGLAWTHTGDLGRAGGLTWMYANINRADLFKIAWVVCDDPATPCGLSLDGPIDAAPEHWLYDATSSDLVAGKLVFTNTTHIALADTSTPQLSGRLTITITDSATMPIAFAPLSAFGITPRIAQYGAAIAGTAFQVVALAEVQDSTMTWTPYLDYYDAAATGSGTGSGSGTAVSFGGDFYDK